MAGFSVNLAGLQGMQAQMGRMADDVSAIRAYLGKISPDMFSSLLSTKARFEEVYNTQVANAVNAQMGAQSVSNEVGNTRDYYAQTDQAQVAAFDAKLPGSPTTNWSGIPETVDRPAGPYRDVNNPQGRLTEPPSHDEMDWDPEIKSDIGNVPSLVRSAIKAIMGEDPLEKLEEFLMGNWKEIRRSADRFNSVAWAFRDCADNIVDCQGQSAQDWTGNAADGARSYMVNLANGFTGEFERNEWLSSELADFSEGICDLTKAAVSLASDWINNKLLSAVASSAVAGSTEEVPLLDIVTDVYAGKKIYDAIKAGMEVYDKVNKINDMIDGLTAALTIGTSGSLHTPDDAPPMPTTTYQSPA